MAAAMEIAVERRLRGALSSSVVRFRKLKNPTFACVTMDNGKAVITLPRGFDDDYILRTLLHELMHFAMPGELAAWGSWEEDILERVVEPNLMRWIVGQPRIHAWWLRKLTQLRGQK